MHAILTLLPATCAGLVIASEATVFAFPQVISLTAGEGFALSLLPLAAPQRVAHPRSVLRRSSLIGKRFIQPPSRPCAPRRSRECCMWSIAARRGPVQCSPTLLGPKKHPRFSDESFSGRHVRSKVPRGTTTLPGVPSRSFCPIHIIEPVVDQTARDGALRRQQEFCMRVVRKERCSMLLVCGGANGYSCGHTHVPLVEPCGLQQLIVVDTKRCPHTRRSRCESYHERLRERPGLAGKVSCLGSINDNPDLLHATIITIIRATCNMQRTAENVQHATDDMQLTPLAPRVQLRTPTFHRPRRSLLALCALQADDFYLGQAPHTLHKRKSPA